ncbi:hypothetical protein ES703_17504 [subsurface metagenome]
MECTDLLSDAAALIIGLPKNDPGPYGLFANDKKLRVRPLKKRREGDIFIMRFITEESKTGLLSSDWNRLDKKLRGLRKGGIL